MKRLQDWAITVLCWDGAFPLVIAALASVLMLLPKNEDLGTLFAVFAPICAFFIRLRIGSRHFETHAHYGWQGVVFLLAILVLILLDCTLILFRQLGEASSLHDWLVWMLLYLIYLSMMALALFPFSGAPAAFDPDAPLSHTIDG